MSKHMTEEEQMIEDYCDDLDDLTGKLERITDSARKMNWADVEKRLTILARNVNEALEIARASRQAVESTLGADCWEDFK
jgi:glutamine synthetase type III